VQQNKVCEWQKGTISKKRTPKHKLRSYTWGGHKKPETRLKGKEGGNRVPDGPTPRVKELTSKEKSHYRQKGKSSGKEGKCGNRAERGERER